MASKIHTQPVKAGLRAYFCVHRWNGEPQWGTVVNIYRKKKREKIKHWETCFDIRLFLLPHLQRISIQASSDKSGPTPLSSMFQQWPKSYHYRPLLAKCCSNSWSKPFSWETLCVQAWVHGLLQQTLVKPPLVHQQLCLVTFISLSVGLEFRKCSQKLRACLYVDKQIHGERHILNIRNDAAYFSTTLHFISTLQLLAAGNRATYLRMMEISRRLSSSWFQPNWKIVINWIISPQGVKNQESSKPPRYSYIVLPDSRLQNPSLSLNHTLPRNIARCTDTMQQWCIFPHLRPREMGSWETCGKSKAL